MKPVEWRPRNVLIDVARVTATAVGSAVFVVLSGGSVWAGVVGALVGFGVELGVEYVVRLHREVERLAAIEARAADEREHREYERKLWEHQLLVANRARAVAEVDVSVWGGLFNEQQKNSPHPVPVDVILARKEVEQKARGLHLPLPPEPRPPHRKRTD